MVSIVCNETSNPGTSGVALPTEINAIVDPTIVTVAPSSNRGRRGVTRTVACYYQNVRGLNTKTCELYVSSLYLSYDIITFSETWLTNGVLDSEIFCEKFSVFRCDRRPFVASRGGGTLLAIRNELNPIGINLPEHFGLVLPMIDISCCRISLCGTSLYILAVYIPSSSIITVTYYDYSLFFEYLQALECLHQNSFVVIGDFNIPEFVSHNEVCKQLSCRVCLLLNNLHFYNAEQFNSIVNHHGKLLDLVVSNTPCRVFRDTPILPEDIYHPALSITVSISSKPSHDFNLGSVPYVFNFKKANFPGLYHSLYLTDWSFLYHLNDINTACTQFYVKVNEILNKFVPKKRIKKPKYPVWFDYSIIRDLKEKEKLHTKYKSSHCPVDYEQYSRLRSKIKRNVLLAYNKYMAEIDEQITRDPSSFWSFLQNKRRGTRIPGRMTYNGVTYDSPAGIVDSFAEFFSSSFTTCTYNPNIVNDSYSVSQAVSVHVEKFCLSDISKAIKKLKNKFTQGPDNLPSFLIKDCASIFVEPLCFLFNLSLHTCTFPDTWKISKACPVYKSGDKDAVENYRQITIMCNFAKVFEYALLDYISPHIVHHLSPNQHGFVHGRSTTTNLCCFTQYTSEILDKGGQVDVVYLDLSKAFDSVHHGILLSKLHSWGFTNSLVSFFESYLSGRTLHVSYSGCCSKPYMASSGVPQGSVLGPALFNIFINDLDTCISSPRLFYADDLKVFRSVVSITDQLCLQHDLIEIANWINSNGLALNIQKCKIMTFSNKLNPLKFVYCAQNEALKVVDNFTDLGVMFDSNLRFDLHVSHVVSLAIKSLGFVIRNSKQFRPKTVLMLYCCFVRSRLEYASLSWFPYYSYQVTSLESVQRRFLKWLVFNLDGQYPEKGFPQQQLLARFNVDSLDTRRRLSALSFLYKLVHGIIDSPELLMQLPFRTPLYNRSTRNSELFLLPSPRTNILIKSPVYIMCSYYNSSSVDIFSYFSDVKLFLGAIKESSSSAAL